jgi:flagellum-specific peptidoglycan hydrolase FlgJ
MRNKLLLIVLTLILSSFDNPNPYDSYIKDHIFIATKYHNECGIPVSIQIAQAIAESGGGKSNLGKNANNHFGMMAFSNWNGQVIRSSTGNWKKYNTVEDSYRDHAEFLHDNYTHAVGKPADYWVKNCKGYGASNKYWKHIGSIIDLYDLTKYDKKIYPYVW